MNRRHFLRTGALGAAGVAAGAVALSRLVEDDVARLERLLARGGLVQHQTFRITRDYHWPAGVRCGIDHCRLILSPGLSNGFVGIMPPASSYDPPGPYRYLTHNTITLDPPALQLWDGSNVALRWGAA
jgi:hypothetical protein